MKTSKRTTRTSHAQDEAAQLTAAIHALGNYNHVTVEAQRGSLHVLVDDEPVARLTPLGGDRYGLKRGDGAVPPEPVPPARRGLPLFRVAQGWWGACVRLLAQSEAALGWQQAHALVDLPRLFGRLVHRQLEAARRVLVVDAARGRRLDEGDAGLDRG